MMLTGQAVLGGVGQYAAKHPAQRVARQHVVSDMIGRHYRSCRVLMLPRICGRCWWSDSPVPHATPPWAQGQQALPPPVKIPGKPWKGEQIQIEVEASVARCLRTPPSGA